MPAGRRSEGEAPPRRRSWGFGEARCGFEEEGWVASSDATDDAGEWSGDASRRLSSARGCPSVVNVGGGKE